MTEAAPRVEVNKGVVQRLVDEAINAWRIEVIDELFEPEAGAKARRDFTSCRAAFPDWTMELVELVAEDEVVVARFKCRGTHLGPWMNKDPTGKAMEVDEVFFFRFRGGLITETWALEDTWTRQRQLGFLRRTSPGSVFRSDLTRQEQ
jgi:predicted ester cyclase